MIGFKSGKTIEGTFTECKFSDETRAIIEKIERERREHIDWMAEQTSDFILSCLTGASHLSKIAIVEETAREIVKKARKKLEEEQE